MACFYEFFFLLSEDGIFKWGFGLKKRNRSWFLFFYSAQRLGVAMFPKEVKTRFTKSRFAGVRPGFVTWCCVCVCVFVLYKESIGGWYCFSAFNRIENKGMRIGKVRRRVLKLGTRVLIGILICQGGALLISGLQTVKT